MVKYLIDTNVVIDYLWHKLPKGGEDFMQRVIDEVPKVSLITEIELFGYNNSVEDEKILSDFFNIAEVLPITNKEKDICIEMKKKRRSKTPDALIAATAISHNYTLLTHNVADFKKIEGLKVVDPHTL
ncbi:nucleotide-binding protein [Bacteroidia bacterium]|nr:nucleotide-binding protein [Bacteroidia bacterium]